MAKNPSFQFYPADWRNNANLRRCSWAARGAWMDLLSILHDSDEYGICRWPLAELVNAAGVPMKLTKELIDKHVLKGSDKDIPAYIYRPRHAGKEGDPVTLIEENPGPCWYSSRLVRDAYIRTQRGKGTRFESGQPPPNEEPIHATGDDLGSVKGDGPSSTSTSTVTEKRDNAQVREDFPDGGGAASVRPDYAPTTEQAVMFFAQKGLAHMADAFMRENDKAGWHYRDGTPIKNWEAWAQGFVSRVVSQERQSAKIEAQNKSDDDGHGNRINRKIHPDWPPGIPYTPSNILRHKNKMQLETWEQIQAH
jgi:hypothetical protein